MSLCATGRKDQPHDSGVGWHDLRGGGGGGGGEGGEGDATLSGCLVMDGIFSSRSLAQLQPDQSFAAGKYISVPDTSIGDSRMNGN